MYIPGPKVPMIKLQKVPFQYSPFSVLAEAVAAIILHAMNATMERRKMKWFGRWRMRGGTMRAAITPKPTVSA